MRRKTSAEFSEREIQRLLRHAYRPPRQRKKWRSGGGRTAYNRREWTLAEMESLGTLTDLKTARLFNRTLSSVSHKRRRLGIPPWTPQPPRWTEEEHGMLGRLPD